MMHACPVVEAADHRGRGRWSVDLRLWSAKDLHIVGKEALTGKCLLLLSPVEVQGTSLPLVAGDEEAISDGMQTGRTAAAGDLTIACA